MTISNTSESEGDPKTSWVSRFGALRGIYGYGMFTGKRARQMKAWLTEQAEID